jgi:Lrp/AsnC family transcriptional regulator, leucine-responsive regulatory protein
LDILPVTQKNDLDEVDFKIIKSLIANARISMSDLARITNMSAPSVTERVRRLEANGLVQAFTIEIDPKALGYTLEAIVRIKPRPGQLHLVERLIIEQPQFLSCDKVTGDDCFVARLCLRSIEELDTLLDPLHERAETSTSIVKSSPVRKRMPPLAQDRG